MYPYIDEATYKHFNTLIMATVVIVITLYKDETIYNEYHYRQD